MLKSSLEELVEYSTVNISVLTVVVGELLVVVVGELLVEVVLTKLFLITRLSSKHSMYISAEIKS